MCRVVLLFSLVVLLSGQSCAGEFRGRFYSGRGDVEYIRLLDISRRMFSPDPDYQNMSMLYMPWWNGLVEGPTWDAWWVQNSYGTTLSALPFLEEPFVTFLQNSHDLWFDQMGDGKRVGKHDWVAPDGCLCDCARPGMIVYKQGDGQIDIHDWGMEFTAAGIVMQAELLLISRDMEAIARYLPKLERSANFIETRRDPSNNLFRAGPAGNLLAPSYAGWKKPDGSYGEAWLSGLSITYIAALDRLVELEKLAKRPGQVKLYEERRNAARKGLAALMTEEGYFVRSIDPDGVKHGVYGAEKHGYLETSPNHDAIALHVVDEVQSKRIMDKIRSIPELRPYQFIIPNYPSYDDMYTAPEGLWAFGTWVNGGHWSTCEARMMLAYSRLGLFEENRKSMLTLLPFAEKFRMDNPLTKFGSELYQPNEPVNLCYDSFGPPAAMIRGLFEYRYLADKLLLIPHVPPGITALHQHRPVRFGDQQIRISTAGVGEITAVRIDGKDHSEFTTSTVVLRPELKAGEHFVAIGLGGSEPPERLKGEGESGFILSIRDSVTTRPDLVEKYRKLRSFCDALTSAGVDSVYELSHAQLAADACAVAVERVNSRRSEKLPEASRVAADKMYTDAAERLIAGLTTVMDSYTTSTSSARRRVGEKWREVMSAP